MAASVPALVEPAVLRWARESIGLTALAAERKLGLPEGRVEVWEAGEATPTIAQLRAAANVYKRPLGVFFLAEPPPSTGRCIIRPAAETGPAGLSCLPIPLRPSLAVPFLTSPPWPLLQPIGTPLYR